jgi:activator of HSP90 ATPase
MMGTGAALSVYHGATISRPRSSLYTLMISEERILVWLRKTLGRSPTKSGVVAGMVHFAGRQNI